MTVGERLIRDAVRESIRSFLKESQAGSDKERKLYELFAYLSQKPTHDIYDGNGKGAYINTTYPAYNYFEPKAVVHDAWAVHYTNIEGLEGIIDRGFHSGVSDYDRLAYTNGYGTKRSNGWSFAIPVDNRYIGEDFGYGDCGFVILTDGVRAYHNGDGDDEIIFMDSHVKKKFPFVYEDDYGCWVLHGFGLSKSDALVRGAYWCEELERAVFSDIRGLIAFVMES